MCNDEILLVHFSTPLNPYDEKFFSLIEKQQNTEKNSIFLFGIVIINIASLAK